MCCAVGVDHLAIVLVLHLFLPESSRSRYARSQGGSIQLFSLPTAQEFKLIGQCLMTVYVGQILVGQSLMPALFSKEPFADAALKLCIMDLPEITFSVLLFTGKMYPQHGFWLDYLTGCQIIFF